jgi:hypothetical protein
MISINVKVRQNHSGSRKNLSLSFGEERGRASI